ncbi:E domain-containing protein, partial [Staphylococcus hominis]|nr:E domain-containing protein [Staphylococcus hominis]
MSKRRQGPINKRLDFISNKLNKYSIRKFTVGTASILVGATLIFGHADDEAKAAEENHMENTSLNSIENDNDKNNQKIDSSNETTTTSTEEATTKEAPLSEENTEEATTKEAPSSEENTEEATTKEAPSSEENTEEAPAVEETNAKSNSNAQPAEAERTQVVDTVAKDLYNKSEVTEAEKAEIEKVLPKDISNLSNEEIKKIALSEALKETANKENAQPRATFRSVSSNARTTNVNYSATALRAAAQDTVTKKGTGNFKEYGDIIHKTYKEEFPKEDKLTAFNTNFNPDTGTKGALEYNDKIDFNKDFTITVPVANNNQGNTTGADGWGFMFTQGNGQDFLNQGGILRDKGMANASGFKIDTAYNNVNGKVDKLDADKTNNLSQIGAAKVGYGTFVKNGADGMTNQVGQNALNTKDKPVNKIIYADNTTNHLDGNFHGQRLNDVVLNYDAATSTVTATYAGKTWKATTDDLGIDKSQKYNFLITSSHMQNRYSDGIMRTNLEGVTITTPQADLIDDVEVTKQPIPHKTIREFDPTLEPGSPDVIVQKGEDGESTTTTPTKVDPDTGDVVERGEPTTEVTKNAVDEIVHFAPEEVPQGHKDEFDPNAPKGSEEEVPGKPGIKNPDT